MAWIKTIPFADASEELIAADVSGAGNLIHHGSTVRCLLVFRGLHNSKLWIMSIWASHFLIRFAFS